MDENLLRGIEFVKAGNLKQAQAYLSRVVQADPDSEEGWLWLGQALDDTEKQRYCYQRVLALNPANTQAWKALDDLHNLRPNEISRPTQITEPATQPVEVLADAGEIIKHQPVLKKTEEINLESKSRTSGISVFPPFLFGFILAMLLLAGPFFFLIRYGVFDGYIMSAGMVVYPSMPPVYQRWVDTMVLPTTQPIPPEALSERMAQADPLINQAKELIAQKNYYDALSILNEVISIIPDVDEPYYLRAWCSYFLLNNQRSLEEHMSNIHAAIFDLDQAIKIRSDVGNYYALRGLLYSNLAEMQELSVNRDIFYQAALQNFLTSKPLGFDVLTTPELSVIVMEIQMNECEKGLAGIDTALKNSNLGSKSVSSLYFNQANAYACLGKLDEALESINQAMQYGDVTGEQKMLEATILYQKDEPGEALKILDNLIVQSPNYGGERYTLRALIVFEQGDWDEAYRSMLAGGGNTWQHGGIYSYVQGKMGLKLAGADNRAKSIDALQYAEASLPVTFNVLRSRIQSELVSLGSAPWDLAPTINFQPTPMAEIPAHPTLRPTSTPILSETLAAIDPTQNMTATQTPAMQGRIYQPNEKNIVIVDPQSGTGPLTLSAGSQKIFHFQPPEALSFASVLDVATHLDAKKTGLTPPLLYEFWNPQNRTWVSIEAGWTETDVLYPGSYVLPEGDVYLSIRNLGSAPFKLNNLSITVVLETLDGNLMQFGTK